MTTYEQAMLVDHGRRIERLEAKVEELDGTLVDVLEAIEKLILWQQGWD